MPLKRESLVRILVGMVLVTIIVVYFVERPEHINPVTVFELVETTVLLVGILVAVFVKWAWHLPWFRPWLVAVPDLRGTWRGVLTPIMSDSEAGIQIPCTLLIRQTLVSVKCTMYTRSMTSDSFSGNALLAEDTGEGRLVYSYSTDPRLVDRAQNPRHDGTTILDLRVGIPAQLVGRYFTDRCTRGELSLSFHSKAYDPTVVG